MKIAIVAPCPVPYVVGGAEKLWWGLATHLNDRTAHQAEIIKIPSPERDLLSLLRSYEAFSALDLGGFDAVISGKYPAWMVSHPRHICYMLHRLRGLYDCYPGEAGMDPALASHPGVAGLREFMRRARGSRSALPEFFGRWSELAAAGAEPPGLLDFPGPLARELVHWLDEIALSPSAISRYAAISATVARRPGYFPDGAEVGVAWPPPHRAMAPGGGQAHFFTASRLDGPKRVAMIVEAMKHVPADVPLLVAGEGPEEPGLRRLAAADPRIRFLGYVGDGELAALYRDALAVPFVPYDEDYGLIAVEAMQSGKPVVTTRDAGGPCELVEDGETGLVCDPTPQALGACLARLAADPALAARLGERALERSAGVTWEAVADTLLAPARRARSPAVSGAPRRKIVVTCTFPVFPPRHGGQSRIFHLFRGLAPEFETVVVSLCRSTDPPFEGEMAPGLSEIRIPLSPEHEARDRAIQSKVGTPITDVAMPRLHHLTPALHEALREASRDACAVVASHPYLYPAVADLGLPLWYEAQDLEWHLKTALLEGLPGGKELLQDVYEVERDCARAAQAILCASPDDGAELVRLYGVDPARILDAPNGTDCGRIAFTGMQARLALKERLGLEGSPLAFFMGSGHWPNIDAVKRIFRFATALPGVAFVVIGSVCYAFDPRMKPANVLFLGEVDDVTRNLCLQACDLALNPVEHGSGTNLKMLDFFAAGLPVVSTASGARGLGLEHGRECVLCDIEEFPGAIAAALGEDAPQAGRRALAARALVEQSFDWDAIAGRIKPRLVELADANRARSGPAQGPASRADASARNSS